MDRTKRTRCPYCRKEVSLQNNPYRPFCSRRCKLMDLGAWLGEEYTISSPITERNIPQPQDGREGE